MATNSTEEPLTHDDLISLDEVRMWETDALKEFCRKRGFKVSGTRQELCARVYVLYNSQVPEEPGAKEVEAEKKKDYRTLVNEGICAPDPLKLKQSQWLNEKEGMAKWPTVTYVDLVKFLMKHGHSLSDSTLTSYKTGKAFAYYDNDWLKEVFYSPVSKKHEACFLKAKCQPSNRLSDDPHSVWVKVRKENGEVISAYCSCVAGFSQTCNHVAALLFKIEAVYRLGLSACTSISCSWNKPKSKTSPTFLRLQEMNFSKPAHLKGKLPSRRTAVSTKLDTTREILVADDDDVHYAEFIETIRGAAPTAVVFLPGTHQKASSKTSSVTGDVLTAIEKSSSVEQLLTNLTLTASEIDNVQHETVGQSVNELWCDLRKGRITASRFYNVHTRIETLKKDPYTSLDKLIASFINPSDLSFLAHIQEGSRKEPLAIAALKAKLRSKGHQNVKIKDCGLFIDFDRPYLGASPDGMVTCDCCQETRLVEVKCPSRDFNHLPYLDYCRRLKHKSEYYGQVQGQLAIAGKQMCYFFIYYNDKKNLLQEVALDRRYCKELLNNVEIFLCSAFGSSASIIAYFICSYFM